VLELREFAQRGNLGAFVSDPPFFLRQPAFVGLALRYDSQLVKQLEGRIASLADPESLEYSTILSAALAAIARRNDDLEPDSVDEFFFFEDIWQRWRTLSGRRFGRAVSPIVVEISVEADHPSVMQARGLEPPREGEVRFWQSYRITFRLTRRPMLQSAEAGGRIVPYSRPRFGTLGGFVRTVDGRVFGVTAAHVFADTDPFGPQPVRFRPCSAAYATPAFSDVLGLRGPLQRLSLGAFGGWLREAGTLKEVDPPDLVYPGACRASTIPRTSGLDVALVEFPISSHRLKQINIVGTGQVSQKMIASFQGAASGSMQVQPMALSIWYSYDFSCAVLGDRERACIADCLQVASRWRPHFPTVSRSGDSGSWLITNTKEGLGWLGVLVGGEGDRAGVVPAQRIVDQFAGRLGPLIPMI
jgi:hypothetical protein